MIKTVSGKLPVVYSCSGCSGAAQMANYLAVQLNKNGIAQMSCIAGIGSHNKPIVEMAMKSKMVIAIDGCKLACARNCLEQHAVSPALHVLLTDWELPQKQAIHFDKQEADRMLADIEKLIAETNAIPVVKVTVKSSTAKRDVVFVNNGIVIREATTPRDMQLFVDFAHRLYAGNAFYVPQLKKDMADTFNKNKNPVFDFCEARYWLAYKGNRVVGRVAGIINHEYNRRWGKKYMRFGWIDFEDEEAIAAELLKAVEAWAGEKDMDAVHGPLGFTNFDYAGMLIRGFDQLGTFATIYNYPYYPLAVEKAGYIKDVDWVEYKIRLPKAMPEKLEKVAQIVLKRNQLHVVNAGSVREMKTYGRDIFKLINAAYAGLYGMVPLNDKQIDYNIKKYLSFIKPDFISLVLDKENRLAAFGITMPSLSKALQKTGGKLYPFGFLHILKAFRKNNLADLCLVAVRPDLQGKGLNAILMQQLTASYLKNGIEFAESNPELETNEKVQSLWEYYDATQHKRRRCYIKYLQGES
ncbi:MAG: putative zinc-binding protein [Chitinophagaceae bacterium]|nr:putative zinc-binding protein [Chitinophagaceae bacterium]